MSTVHRGCPRCGRRREIRPDRGRYETCRDCRLATTPTTVQPDAPFQCDPSHAYLWDYPESGEVFWRMRVTHAKKLCGECPARTACLTQGIADKETGVWGGILLMHGELSRYERTSGGAA